MGARPRGLCRACQYYCRAKWDGDLLILCAHYVNNNLLCPGSSQPALEDSAPVSIIASPRSAASPRRRNPQGSQTVA
jgi:hypothetical protein